jgi:pteridine reductase
MTTASPSLAGKVALVTGGARRVGRAIALRLAEAGMDVAITYLHSDDAAGETIDSIRAIGRNAHAIRADLARPDAAEQVFAAFAKHFDRLDALVNNASSFAPSAIGQITADDFERHMAVNARTPLMLIQKFAPMLAAHAQVDDAHEPPDRGPTRDAGRVVNFIDIHVMGEPLKAHAAYNASKAALMEITMTAAMELAPKVTVNAVAPGVVAWAQTYTEAERRAYMRRVPLARPGTPDDAAAAVLFLVRDADYCTGQVIRLDGGRLLG